MLRKCKENTLGTFLQKKAHQKVIIRCFFILQCFIFLHSTSDRILSPRFCQFPTPPPPQKDQCRHTSENYCFLYPQNRNFGKYGIFDEHYALILFKFTMRGTINIITMIIINIITHNNHDVDQFDIWRMQVKDWIGRSCCFSSVRPAASLGGARSNLLHLIIFFLHFFYHIYFIRNKI